MEIPFELLPEDYVVHVDHTATRAEAIAAGAYDRVEIDGDDWSGSGLWPALNGPGTGGERRLRLARFHTSHTIGDAGYILLESGLANVGLPDLLAFGATYPQVQTRFPITAWMATTLTFGEPDYQVGIILAGSDRALASGDRRWLLPDGPVAAGFRSVVSLYPWHQQWDDGRVVNGLQAIRFLVYVNDTADDVLARYSARLVHAESIGEPLSPVVGDGIDR